MDVDVTATTWVGAVVGVVVRRPAVPGRGAWCRTWPRRGRPRWRWGAGGHRSGRRGGVGALGVIRGRALGPGVGQHAEEHHDGHHDQHGGAPPGPVVHGVEGVALGPVEPGTRWRPRPEGSRRYRSRGPGVVEDQRRPGVGELVVAPDGHRGDGVRCPPPPADRRDLGPGAGRSGPPPPRRPPGTGRRPAPSPSTAPAVGEVLERTRVPSGSCAPSRCRPRPVGGTSRRWPRRLHHHGSQDDPHPDYSTRRGSPAGSEARSGRWPAAGGGARVRRLLYAM